MHKLHCVIKDDLKSTRKPNLISLALMLGDLVLHSVTSTKPILHSPSGLICFSFLTAALSATGKTAQA